MPKAHVHTFAASATSSASLSISVGTPIWLHWLRIAKEQTARARRGANTAPSPPSAGEVTTEMAGSITDEMYPAMMAIAAVAFALDGLYDQVRGLAPPRPAKGRPKRERLILETLKHAFAIGSYAQSWLVEFDWLDELRDPAVHPEHHTPTSSATTSDDKPAGRVVNGELFGDLHWVSPGAAEQRATAAGLPRHERLGPRARYFGRHERA